MGKKRTVHEIYLKEPVLYGGEWMTRGEMLDDLNRVFKGNQRYVTRYLQGFEEFMHRVNQRMADCEGPSKR